MYSTTQAKHTICAQIFTGCMFASAQCMGDDFHDVISSEALYTTLPEDFANCVCAIPLYIAITQQLDVCIYPVMCIVAVALENTPDTVRSYRHVYILSA